ncbi:MAG: aspartate aminotransferase family protein [Saprospiraceae bacterium]
MVSRLFNPEEVRSDASTFSFDQTNDAEVVMLHTIEGIKQHGVQVTHPSYLGLFNPRPSFPSIMADVINSYLNPQMAAWSHAPFAVEIEQLVIKEFGKKFGYEEDKIDGVFCIGGTESNLTAVLAAMQKYLPNIAEDGLLNIKKKPIIYASTESHHSMERAARTVGLGTSAVKKIPVHQDLRMNVEALRLQIIEDIENGCQPFMVVGTTGTTGAGVFDDLEEISKICKEYDLWLHADAAYGGGAIITDLKHLLKGIEKSDSITLDLHKWFSVPMATSIFLTSDPQILSQTFNVRTNYMPEDGNPDQIFDPYVKSLQWSRRFIGLKIYLPLAVFGWEGYTKTIAHQIEMGNQLRTMLKEKGWIIVNQSELPIVCFTHSDIEEDKGLVQKIIDEINVSGKTWISSYPINGKLTLRAQIANYDTQVEDLEKFVNLVLEYKQKYNTTISEHVDTRS